MQTTIARPFCPACLSASIYIRQTDRAIVCRRCGTVTIHPPKTC